MSNKAISQCFILAAILLVSFAGPMNAQAQSSCGSTYVVQPGDWLSRIASNCGVTLAQMYVANPGVGYYIYPGQVLNIPGSYTGSPGVSYSNTYTVQPGDSFSMIASRYGVSTYNLWAANPQIWDINHIYPGQVIYVPGSSWFNVGSPSTDNSSADLSYGKAPFGAPFGSVKLINNANADVYVSLQGTTKDGVKVINEYTVDAPMRVEVPTGWYTYVAWIGGQKFAGNFTLRQNSNYFIKFYSNRVVVE